MGLAVRPGLSNGLGWNLYAKMKIACGSETVAFVMTASLQRSRKPKGSVLTGKGSENDYNRLLYPACSFYLLATQPMGKWPVICSGSNPSLHPSCNRV